MQAKLAYFLQLTLLAGTAANRGFPLEKELILATKIPPPSPSDKKFLLSHSGEEELSVFLEDPFA